MQLLTLGMVVSNRVLLAEVQECLRGLPARVVIEQPEIREWSDFADKLTRLRPDVVLLDLTDRLLNVEEAIRGIRQSPSAPVVIGLHTAPDPAVILRAIRSGATEYVYPPLHDSMRGALERIAAERSQQHREKTRGQVIGFLSVKGGCGATTIACHTGVDLRRRTKKDVLLADFDLGTGLLGFLLKTKSSYNVVSALENIHRMDASFWKALVANGHTGLDVIPAPATAPALQKIENDRFSLLLHFVRSQYDYIVADLGRGVDAGVVSALEEVDDLYLVTSMEVPALYCARQCIRKLREAGYNAGRIHTVLNRVSRKADVTPEDVQQMLGVTVSAAVPDDPGALYEAYADGQLAPANSAVGRKLSELAARIAGMQPVNGNRTKSILGAGG